MPGKIKVKVLAGRNLPVMDRASDTTDAFVEIKFGSVTHKTDVCRKSLNPHWSSTEWYRFEVDESELQDEPLQLRLMDHDTYSANDAIGKVVISLAPLLARVANTKGGAAAPHGGAMMSGWIPVFDTMHGIRGELNVIVKVELFSDFNKYKTSSCGVQFFHCPMIPPGYKVTAIHGFVEELVVNDDPEYQWIDKIRTPRASNEARQVAFIKLSNQVQRLVGLKAAELGANAVVGYQQDFDLEGEAGVVARAIGTAVSITASPMPNQPPSVPPCSQQQLNKYLDILATENESTTDLNEYFQTHQEELQKLLHILNPKTSSMLDETENIEDEENEKSFELSRQASIKSYTGNYSIYQNEYGPHDSMRHLSEDQTDLNRLLNRNDDYNDMGPLKKIKHFKTNIFRLGSMKSRKSDQADDTISIKSNVSDTSKISLSDIKNEFKKLTRLKTPKLRKAFANKSDEGIGMASVLARSVIHAHTSLARISETQDSDPSPSSTLRRTSESEPTINVSDEEQANRDSESYDNKSLGSDKRTLPAIKFSSLVNVSTDEEAEPTEGRQRKLSESCPSTPVVARKNLLKLPGDVGYFGSVSSALSADSSEAFSSSEEDDESSIKTDTEKTYETTSSVVKSVLNNKVNPVFIAQMDKKLSVLECNTPDLQDDENQQVIESDTSPQESSQETPEADKREDRHSNDKKTEILTSGLNLPEASSSVEETHTFVEPKSHSLHFKFHNPFSHKKLSQSISAPSSPVEKKGFVYRSSSKIKRQISKISKSSMIKSLSHYSLLPKRKHSDPKPALSQPGSASDVPSKAPSETVLGSAFLSYSDLLSLDKEGIDTNNRLHRSDEFTHSRVSMYIGSEPVSRASVSGPSSPNHGKDDYHPHEHRTFKKRPNINPSGLIATAMETILIDKVQNLLVPTSPNPAEQDEKKFFDDVNEKLEKVEEARNRKDFENENIKSTDTSSKDNVEHVTDTKENTPQTISDGNKGASDSKSKQQDMSADISNKTINHSDLEKVELLVDDTNHKKLVRQDSVRSNGSHKMSNETDFNLVSSAPPAPMLQHFHPVLSGVPKLATIPSLPETSVDQTESIDTDGTCLCNDKCECSDTNKASVCDNSHAACDVDRDREREREKNVEKGSPRHARHESYGNRDGIGSAQAHAPNSSLEAASTPQGIHRRSSDSDLSVTPKGGSLNASVGNTGSGGGAILRPSMNSNNLEMLEYPFLTMSEYPPGFIVHIGGTVCARSVKLMDGGGESSSRAAWWAELRTELRAHARALRCNAVIAYTETTAICEDVCVLSASGTAAVIDLECGWERREEDSCSLAHVPYSPGAGPYRAELSVCQGCRRARVPAVLLATCAKPTSLAAYSAAVPLTAVAARARRAPPQAEPGARDISDQLPFLEYELHKLLLAKLRMQGANALFSLQTQVAVGERCVMAIASGTAVRICALPPPMPPRIKATENDKEALEIQKALWDAFTANKAANGYDVVLPEMSTNVALTEADGERGDEVPALDLCADKDACVLELDEAEDVETAKVLAKRRPHMQVFTNSSKALPGAPPQAFAQVWRARLQLSGQGGASTAGERHVARALDGVAYKLRRLRPCALLAPRIQLELPEDEIQLVVSGAAIRLVDPSKVEPSENGHPPHPAEDDDIFALDEEQLVKSQEEEKTVAPTNGQVPTTVSLTSLCYCSGAGTVRRVCALRLLFVRETTAVRELGGLSGFLHTFTCEVLAIARAYTAALGGNALTSFYITQLMLQDNAHKNQGQCLLSVGGDVVHMTY
ncbi:C2 domain-containing protein 5 isoform X1 [Cydia splendana]|uniref:C2 domain-containing protein 5 isoform X1 n=1 Tax=Cydia splendana TaxID=1100963 RepID=UPI0028F465C5